MSTSLKEGNIIKNKRGISSFIYKIKKIDTSENLITLVREKDNLETNLVLSEVLDLYEIIK